MAAAKLVAFILLALVFTTSVFADAGISTDEPQIGEAARSDGSLKIQLDQLHAKIHALESQIDEKSREVKGKVKLQKTNEEQKKKIGKLERAIKIAEEEMLRTKLEATSKAKELLEAHGPWLLPWLAAHWFKFQTYTVTHWEAHGKPAVEIVILKVTEAKAQAEKWAEPHVENVKTKYIPAIKETVTTHVEPNVRTLSMKAKDAYHASKSAVSPHIATVQEEMLRTKLGATLKAKELLEAHGPWLAAHWFKFQTYTETHWEAHGKPAVEIVILKVTEAKAQAEKWAEPHVENIKTKYIPAIKETVTTHVEPHVRTLSIKAKDAYHASKRAVSPHIATVQELVDPYYQEAKKFSKPYVDQVATTTNPHVDKLKVTMKPYTTKVIIVYKEFLESATTYHQQVQAHVEQKLKSHELTERFATNEFVWFAASSLFAFPIFIAYQVLSSLFCTKTKKPVKHPHHHGRCMAKRSHTDK